MTLLAHWRIADGINDPVTAVDSVGSHNGTYNYGLVGRIVPGGIGGTKLQVGTSGFQAYIDSILNPSSLRLLSEMTVMSWVTPEDAFGNRYVANVSGLDETEAENNCWSVEIGTNRSLRMTWETSTGTDITVQSINDILPVGGICHIAVVRQSLGGNYEVLFYVNGVLLDTQDNGAVGYTGPTGGGNSLPFIGKLATVLNPYDYYLDSVRVYDSVENAASILSVYNTEQDDYDNLDVESSTITNLISLHEYGDVYDLVYSGASNGRDDSGFRK